MIVDKVSLKCVNKGFHLTPGAPFTNMVSSMPGKVWDEITYQFPNFNDATLEVWEWMGNFVPRFKINWLVIHAGVKAKPC